MSSGDDLQCRTSLSREQIQELLREHRDQAGYEHIVSRPNGGWLIFTISHVFPDGRMDDTADSGGCLDMYDADQVEDQTTA